MNNTRIFKLINEYIPASRRKVRTTNDKMDEPKPIKEWERLNGLYPVADDDDDDDDDDGERKKATVA
jgi:hypothetical protein